MSGLTDRSKILLKALVELYLETGVAVGSQTLVNQGVLPVSPATVRALLAELEEKGFLRSPHTSAGRIPTSAGLKCFVETLMTQRSPETSAMLRMEAALSETDTFEKTMYRATTVLSETTQLVGLAWLGAREVPRLRNISLVSLGAQEVLAVLIYNQREIHNKILRVPKVSPSVLEAAQQYFEWHCQGKTLKEARDTLAAELSKEQTAYHTLSVWVEQLLTIFDQEVTQTDLYLRPIEDIARLHDWLAACEEKQAILALLEQCLTEGDTRVFIGEGKAALKEITIIASPCMAKGDVVGVIGVVGPTRLSYQAVIPWVKNTASLVERALSA